MLLLHARDTWLTLAASVSQDMKVPSLLPSVWVVIEGLVGGICIARVHANTHGNSSENEEAMHGCPVYM